jgi:hypothetical protein
LRFFQPRRASCTSGTVAGNYLPNCGRRHSGRYRYKHSRHNAAHHAQHDRRHHGGSRDQQGAFIESHMAMMAYPMRNALPETTQYGQE